MNFFEMLKRSPRLPYVVLLHGPKGAKKAEEALLASQYLLESKEQVHVDLHQFYPEGKSGLHTIQSMRRLCQEIYLSSHAGGYKCFIIHHAERMLPVSSNALLKTFEEPPEKCIIFLLTAKPTLILPTIRSRSQSYALQGEKEDRQIQSRFLQICAYQLPLSELGLLCEELEEERKQEEQNESKLLSKEITGLQREMMVKEIEGRSALLYQEKREILFETLLAFHRDLFFYHQGASEKDLYFPEFIESYKSRKPKDLSIIEAKLQKARQAQDRGVKLVYCLEESL